MPLSFFTNAGNSYGSQVPFQRIVEPAQLGMFLNLEQAELLRIQRYNEGWRFYFGKQWLFKREDGEPLVTRNYFRKIIDKCAAFLAGKGFNIQTPDVLEEITLPFLNEVWKSNRKKQFAWDAALMGGVTGDVFALVTFETPTPMQRQINPYTQGQIRVQLLGSEQVYPTWDPLNVQNLLAVRIETIFYADRGMHTLDRDDRTNHQGRQLQTKRFTQIITPSQIVEQAHGEMPVIKPNTLGEIPLVHIANMSVPKEYYGLPDGQDLIDLQRELNEKSTDVSDIINYHASPVTIIFGAKAKQLERGPRQIWSGLPSDAKVQNLALDGDLNASVGYIDSVKKTMHDLSDVPATALGDESPISNTSGVALHMRFQPLVERTERKKDQYEPGIEQINYFILRIGVVMGMLNIPFDLCSNCGGRIVEIDTGKMRRVWNPESQRYDIVPMKAKRCYHVNRETLEFEDPEKMRITFWRQYGFGKQLREAPLDQIERELKEGKPSFWDYTVIKKQLQEKHRAENPPPEPAEKAPEIQMEADLAEARRPPPEKPEKDSDLPEELKIIPIPEEEIDFPEEPEEVEITQRWVHPQTQQLLEEEKMVRMLVPTGCNRPQYLNPYDTKVEFPDPLPKDEALRATLYEQYQRNQWVDPEWCQDRIPEIAVDKTAIQRRIKKNGAPPGTAPGTKEEDPSAGKRQANVMGADAGPRMQNKVPGKGGNPVKPGKEA